MNVSIVQKVEGDSQPGWTIADDYPEVLDNLRNGVNIAAGTAFMWSREDFEEVVDVLFVDEAGQLSLIDTLAVSQSAKRLVLLGDPQQLQQPQQGSHPEGTEVSALAHILDNANTIDTAHGIFLGQTWRMHPEICSYVSELFYESRLTAHDKNHRQRLEGDTKYTTPGIYVEMLRHSNNSNKSVEEVAVTKRIVGELINREVYFNDREDERERLTAEGIKVISPYNAQVNALTDALPGMQIGTVDKFQGQEAPVIIFSMATSSPEDAPRGMEFLYSLNRLNVAVSRARAVFILVASAALFEPNCRSPRHMKLANALCRLLERSQL